MSLLSSLHGVTEVIDVNTAETHKTVSKVKPGGSHEMSGFLRSHIILEEISVHTERKEHPFSIMLEDGLFLSV